MAGTPGLAMLALLIADFVQLPDDPGQLSAHASTLTLILIRGPLSLLALLIAVFYGHWTKLRLSDLRLWSLIFAVFYVLSTAWSTYPFATLGKGFEILLAVVILIQATGGESAPVRLRGMFQLTLLVVSSFALLTVLGYLAGIQAFVFHKPGVLFGTSAESPFLSGNGLGYAAACLMLLVFAQWQFCDMPLRTAGVEFFYATSVFFFSSSRTSLALLLAGFGLILLRRSKVLLFAVGLPIFGLLVYYFDAISQHLSFGEADSTIQSLSGRTVMWAAAFEQWKQHPWLGFGGGAGGKYVLANIGNSLDQMSSLHSGFMESLSGLGLIGFTLQLGLFLVVTYRVLKSWKRDPRGAPWYGLIVFFWVTTIMSLGVFGWMTYQMQLYFLLIGLLDWHKRYASRATMFSSRFQMRAREARMVPST
jgi:O-antigen ligase